MESPRCGPKAKGVGLGFSQQWQRGERRQDFAGAQEFLLHVSFVGYLVIQVLVL